MFFACLGTLTVNSTEHDLIYIGHSMGTTMNFVLLSEKPEYNEKIKLFIALAPVAFMTHIKSPIRFLAPFSKDIEVSFQDRLSTNSMKMILKSSFRLIF